MRHGTVTGILHIEGVSVTLADPLDVELPTTDLQLGREFVGAAERGVVRFGAIDDDTWWFVTVMPKRRGSSGVTADGLFGAGTWYPALLRGGEPLETAAFDVHVVADPSVIVVVSDRASTGQAHWVGLADRVGMAAVPHGRITAIDTEGTSMRLVTRGRPRKSLVRGLEADLAQMGPHAWVISGVEAPLRDHLTDSTPGLVYLSDRAYRITPGLFRFHRVPVARGLFGAALPIPDRPDRDLAAAALADSYGRRLRGRSLDGWLERFDFTPAVDSLLQDRRTPFWSDVLERQAELPQTQLVAQIRDGFGDDALDLLALSLATGLGTRDAADLAGIPPEWLVERIHAAPFESDLSVTANRGVGTVRRAAPADAPPEPVRVDVDGERRVVWVGPGPASVDLPGERFRVDPAAHVDDPDRSDLTAPSHYRLLATGWIAAVNVSDLWIVAEGVLAVRRSGSMHGGPAGRVYSNRTDLVGAELGWSYGFGHLVDGLSRAGRIRGSVGAALLDPRFNDEDKLQIALDARLSAGWDDRQAWDFPLAGRFYGASLRGGIVPSTGSTYGSARAFVGGIVSPGDVRHSLAIEALGGVATGDVDQRLLSLGGSDGLLSVDPTAVVGNGLAVGRAEWRWAPSRDLSVPLLWLAWLSEVHLSGGVEAGGIVNADGLGGVIGGTAGIGVDADLLGMSPGYLGVSAGWPLWTSGVDVQRKPFPEWTLRGQAWF